MNARQKAKKLKKELNKINDLRHYGFKWLKVDDIYIKPEEPMPWYEDRRFMFNVPYQTYVIRIGNMQMECTPTTNEDTLIVINSKEFSEAAKKALNALEVKNERETES